VCSSDLLCGADIFENVDAAPWTKSITSKIPLSLALEFLDCIVQPLSKILLKQWTSHRGFRSIAPHDTIYEYVFEKSMVLSLPFVSEDKENSPFLWILDAIERLRNPLISSLSTKWKYTDLYLLPQEWSAALSSIPLTALVVAFAIRCLYKKVWNVRKATLKNSTKLTVDIDDEEETTTQIDSLVDPKASEGHPADKYQLFDLSPRTKSQPQTPEHLQLSRTNAPLPNTQHNSFVTVPHAEISLLEQASPPALQVNTRVTASHSQISLPKQASPSSTNFAPQLNTGVMAASHSQINHPEQVSPSFTNFTPQTPQQYYSPSWRFGLDPWVPNCDGYRMPSWPVSPWQAPYPYYMPASSSTFRSGPFQDISSPIQVQCAPREESRAISPELPPRGHPLPSEAILDPAKDFPKNMKDSDTRIFAKNAILGASSAYKDKGSTPEKVYWPPGRIIRDEDPGMYF